MKKITFLFFFFTFLFCSFFHTNYALAQEITEEETLEGTVVKILEEGKMAGTGEGQKYQKLEISVTQGSLKDQNIIVENGLLPTTQQLIFKKGDKLVLSKSQDIDGNNYFQITDYVRRGPILFLFIIFCLLTLFIARGRGLSSLFGMAVSFLIIFTFILPQILAGFSPVLVAIAGSLLIIPVTFYLSHGFNKKTTIAVAGTFLSLVITGILAVIFVEAAKLTGFSSEEAGFLQFATQGAINIKGLLLAGIIIGVLGVLDDITISQAAIVFQLKEANPNLKVKELYKRAMDIGRDHISSMVNTLILVYTGASLPLLLLFVNNPHPFSEVVNYEIIADEIIRTLVGSIGLVLAVPITTYLSCLAVNKKISLRPAKS
jgi:uncharacterized membrane protein